MTIFKVGLNQVKRATGDHSKSADFYQHNH